MRARIGLFACVLLFAGCPEKRVARPYPPPTAQTLLRHLVQRAGSLRTLRADAKVDYRAERGDRIKGSLTLLVESPDRLRMEAEGPFGGTVASLATDGQNFELLDVRNNRFLAGPATPCNIARVIRVELAPADVVAIIEGSVPLLGGGAPPVRAEVGWDDRSGGREVLRLRAPTGEVQTLRLDATDRRWDLLEGELRDPRGKVVWRLVNSGWSDVDGVRLPGKSTIEQPERKADVRIRYRSRDINPTPPPGVFHLEPPIGIPIETVNCE